MNTSSRDIPTSRPVLDELQQMRWRIAVDRAAARDEEQTWERWRLAVMQYRAEQAQRQQQDGRERSQEG